MNIALGCDHVGFSMKQRVVDRLMHLGHIVVDFGTNGTERVDYPFYGKKVAQAVVAGQCDAGVLMCGTGVGISIAANKVCGARAVVCSEPYSAQMSRRHNDANILAFGSRVIGEDLAEMILDAFLTAEFEGGRHLRRIQMLEGASDRV